MEGVQGRALQLSRNPAKLLLLRKWLWSYIRHVALALAKVGSGSCSCMAASTFPCLVYLKPRMPWMPSKHETVDVVCMAKTVPLCLVWMQPTHCTAVSHGAEANVSKECSTK